MEARIIRHHAALNVAYDYNKRPDSCYTISHLNLAIAKHKHRKQ